MKRLICVVLALGVLGSLVDGNRTLRIVYISPPVPEGLAFAWEDWKQQLVVAALLYGGFADEEEIYRAFSEKELSEDEPLPLKKTAQFYEEHSGEILSCQSAKRYFDSIGMKQLPSIQSPKQEYAALMAENKKLYPEFKQARAKMIELMTAKNNTDRILGLSSAQEKLDCLY